MFMKKCPFCRIIAGKKTTEDKIFEDDKVLIMLDEDWAVKGHTLVIWKKHVENASELSIEDFEYFLKILYKTEKALLGVLGVERSILLKSGCLVSHFHFHIYPVKKETDWQTIKDIFDKKLRYQSKPGEKKELIFSLRKCFQN